MSDPLVQFTTEEVQSMLDWLYVARCHFVQFTDDLACMRTKANEIRGDNISSVEMRLSGRMCEAMKKQTGRGS